MVCGRIYMLCGRIYMLPNKEESLPICMSNLPEILLVKGLVTSWYKYFQLVSVH